MTLGMMKIRNMASRTLASAAIAVALIASPASAQEGPEPFNPEDFNPIPKPDPWLLKSPGELLGELADSAGETVKGWGDAFDSWRQEIADERKKARDAARKEKIKFQTAAARDMLARGFTREQIAAVLAFRDHEDGWWQQANRALADSRSFDFVGSAEDDGDQISFYGRKEGPYIVGNYTLTLEERQQLNTYSGSFAGTVSRFNTATGTYIRDKEYGTFSGVVNNGLNTIFSGGFTCQNCRE